MQKFLVIEEAHWAGQVKQAFKDQVPTPITDGYLIFSFDEKSEPLISDIAESDYDSVVFYIKKKNGNSFLNILNLEDAKKLVNSF